MHTREVVVKRPQKSLKQVVFLEPHFHDEQNNRFNICGVLQSFFIAVVEGRDTEKIILLLIVARLALTLQVD